MGCAPGACVRELAVPARCRVGAPSRPLRIAGAAQPTLGRGTGRSTHTKRSGWPGTAKAFRLAHSFMPVAGIASSTRGTQLMPGSLPGRPGMLDQAAVPFSRRCPARTRRGPLRAPQSPGPGTRGRQSVPCTEARLSSLTRARRRGRRAPTERRGGGESAVRTAGSRHGGEHGFPWRRSATGGVFCCLCTRGWDLKPLIAGSVVLSNDTGDR